jgi:hypothetical protein
VENFWKLKPKKAAMNPVNEEMSTMKKTMTPEVTSISNAQNKSHSKNSN